MQIIFSYQDMNYSDHTLRPNRLFPIFYQQGCLSYELSHFLVLIHSLCTMDKITIYHVCSLSYQIIVKVLSDPSCSGLDVVCLPSFNVLKALSSVWWGGKRLLDFEEVEPSGRSLGHWGCASVWIQVVLLELWVSSCES